jgi:hypothetical protein
MLRVERESLETHLRSLALDNFSIEADYLRIGSMRWFAQPCGCDEAGCDGWRIEPFRESVGITSERPFEDKGSIA